MSRFAFPGVLCCLALALILTLPSFAQVPDPVAAAEAPVPGAGHHYIGIGAETVNPADGSLTFDLPLSPANARELNFTFGIRFTSGMEQYYLSNKVSQGPQLAWTTWGAMMATPAQIGAWSYDLPMVTAQVSVFQSASLPYNCGQLGCQYALNECYGTNNYVFRGLDGNQNTLQIATIYPGSTNTLSTYCPTNNGVPINQFSPGDGHGVYSAMQSTSMAPPVKVIDRAGTVYQFPGTNNYNQPTQPWAFGFLATNVTDRNGNQITLTSSGNGYKDTVGRDAVTWTGIGTSGDQINVAGLGGPVTLQWKSTPLTFPETGTNVGGSGTCTLASAGPSSTNVLGEIDLPNGQKYTFDYDGVYGKIAQITFPGGGHVRYVWARQRLKYLQANWTVPPIGGSQGGSYSCTFNYDVPVITDRYVSFDGTNEILHQSFTYTNLYTSGSLTGRLTTVTSTDSVSAQTTVTKYTYGLAAADGVPFLGNTGQQAIPVETNVLFQDNANHTLKTVNKTWKSPHALLGEQTILDNGQGTATERCYDFNEEVVGLYEYGFQSEGSKPADPSCYSSAIAVGALTNTAIGPLRRQTATVYHPYYTWSYPNPTLPHIVNAPDSVTISDGSGTTIKKTAFLYDGSALATSTANVQLVSPPESARANITTINRYSTLSAYSSTQYTYYATGQVATMTDPCGNGTCTDMTATSTTACNGASVSGHTTSFCYTDNYVTGTGTPPGQTYGYLTQVTYPNTGAAHSESFTWGYSDGQIRSHTDQNSQPTYFLYNDPGLLARLTEIDYPDTGQTTVTYDDSTYNSTNHTPSYTVSQTLFSTTKQLSTTAFDGMGHKAMVLLKSDPQGTDYTGVTTYDGFGRVRLAYNPTRCTTPTTNCGSETTWGYSTTNYDPLNRVSSVLKQDGSTTSTSYLGPCTTVTDEAGKSRKSCVDGLSFLTGVWEDPSSLNYETDYTYDGLGNLTYVNQKGSDSTKARTRSFQYDLLSRLTSATNPESGVVTYAYDLASNLQSKTSPAPNQQLSTVTQTISYCYDGLSRVTSKWYASPTCTSQSSAAAQYAYDQTSFNGLTITNGVGRRTSMTDVSGSSGWSYDSMGRVLALKRKIGTLSHSVTYTYNVGGLPSLVTLFNGSQRQYTYNAAGAAVSLTDPTRSPAYNFVTSASYTPGSALASAVYGNATSFAGITETGIYNTRLQPCWFYATTGTALPTNDTCTATASAGNVLDLKFNFGAGTNDNGNVIQVINDRDNNRTQNFLYDSLNRIQQAYTTGPNWGETFSPTATAPGVAPTSPGIDSWGNLTNRSGVTGKTNTESPLNCAAANVHNQLNTCFGYDAAGNLITNGSLTYTYDAENRLVTAGGATYTYDGDGNRVQKMIGATGTLYWRDSAGVTLIESDASGTAQHGYVFFAGRMIARNDLSPWSAHFYFSDHLGSSNVVTNATGTIEDESDFYPYGGEIVVTNTVPQNYKFTGKERDSESGLDNFGARYYASGMGRFMTPDWAARPTTVPYASFGDPQTLNLYTYVENGPVNRVDADGHGKDCTKSNNTRGCRPGADTDDGGQNTEQRDNNKSTTDAVKAAASQIESYGTISEPISPSTSGPAVTITYDKNVPAMRTKTQEYVEKVAETAGVESINISATTNGQHAPNSNHYNGTAVDINKVNGERVVNAATDPTVGSNVNSIQNAANSPKAGVAHENYGPAGLYKDGKQITNAKLQAEHENHIHITIPRIGP